MFSLKCSTKILPGSPAFPGQGPPKRPGGATKRHLAKATRGVEELGEGAQRRPHDGINGAWGDIKKILQKDI